MKSHDSANTGSLIAPLKDGDMDEEMSDTSDGKSESQYDSANERQSLSPPLDNQQQQSRPSPASQKQDINPTRDHTPLFLGSSSDTSTNAQWETDSVGSEDDKPESDRMSTPRARAQSLPKTDGGEDEIMAAVQEEEQTRHRPSPFSGYQTALDDTVTPRWEEVKRPISNARINTLELPNANWGNSDDAKTSLNVRSSTEGKRPADDEDIAKLHPKKRQNEGKRHIAESLGWMSSRQAIRQTATAQVQLQRQFKADQAELKNFVDNVILRLQADKALLEEQLNERERELQTVVKTMEVKDRELEDRATQFSKEKRALTQQIAELEKAHELLKSQSMWKERQWTEEKEELEDALESSKSSYEKKLKRTHEEAILSLQEQDSRIREEIKSLQDEYELKIDNLEAYIAKLEENDKDKDKASQVVILKKQLKDQGKTIESLQEIIAKSQEDEEKHKKEKEHLQKQLAKFRQDIDEQARSHPEAERRRAEKESGEAATLQRERRAEQRAQKESAIRENDVDISNTPKHSKGTSARPQDGQSVSPSLTQASQSPAKGKKRGHERTSAPNSRATPSPRRSVRPLPKSNGKWKDLKHHSLNKTHDFLHAVEVESDTGSEEANEQRSKKEKRTRHQSYDRDISMASDEEVEEAIVPKQMGAKGDEDEDASMASDEAESPKQRLKDKRTREGKRLQKTRKKVVSDENRYGSEDESNTPLTKKDIASVVANVVKEVLHASGSSPSNGNRKRRRTKRTVNAQLIAEKKADRERDRALYCELVRDTFKKKFSIKYDDEFVTHEAARDEDLEAYFQDETKGPNPEDLHVDTRHKITSYWNKAVIQIMVDAVCEYQAEDEEEKFASLPERSEDYIEELVIQRLERLRGIWRKGQAKVKENGEVESPSEVEDRMAVERDLEEKAARAATRRRARYDRRKETLVRMVELKRDENAEDCFVWEWLLDVVEVLGEAGMSSDESDVDERTGQVVYRVNRLPWRREFSKEMDYIDKQRKEAHLFSKKGSKPITRVREGGSMSRRPEIEELPKIIYDKDWFGRLPSRFRESFKFSLKPLKWLKIFAKK